MNKVLELRIELISFRDGTTVFPVIEIGYKQGFAVPEEIDMVTYQ